MRKGKQNREIHEDLPPPQRALERPTAIDIYEQDSRNVRHELARAAWLVSGSHSITGSVALIWALTALIQLGNFAHCIAASGEVLAAAVSHQLTLGDYLQWLTPATLGNICGGVLLVTLLEYGQVKLE